MMVWQCNGAMELEIQLKSGALVLSSDIKCTE